MEVSFPLNLLLSSKELVIYQTYGRYFFFLRYCQQQINSIYLKLREEKLVFEHPFIRRCFDFTNKMLHLNNALMFHFLYDVVEELFQKFNLTIQKTQDFQVLIQQHHRFINQIGKNSFLFKNEFKEIVCAIHNFFLIFCQNLKTLLDSFKVSDVFQFDESNSDLDMNEIE